MARPKQTHIKGMEPVVNKEVEKLADEYAEERDDWQNAGKVVTELKEKLVAAMKKAKLTAYERGEYDIKLKPGKDGIKVRIGKEDEEDEGDE